MDKATKREQSAKLKHELSRSSGLVLVSFNKLTVADANVLRNKFREAGCSYRVYKNSVILYAISDGPHAAAEPLLAGVSGLAYHPDDPAAAARVARDFAQTNENFHIKGGVIDGKLLEHAGVLQLANMPGLRELEAQLLALLNTPATQLVRVLNAAPQSFLNLLNAKKDRDAA